MSRVRFPSIPVKERSTSSFFKVSYLGQTSITQWKRGYWTPNVSHSPSQFGRSRCIPVPFPVKGFLIVVCGERDFSPLYVLLHTGHHQYSNPRPGRDGPRLGLTRWVVDDLYNRDTGYCPYYYMGDSPVTLLFYPIIMCITGTLLRPVRIDTMDASAINNKNSDKIFLRNHSCLGYRRLSKKQSGEKIYRKKKGEKKYQKWRKIQ